VPASNNTATMHTLPSLQMLMKASRT